VSEVTNTLALIQKDLDLPDSQIIESPEFDFDGLKNYLESAISKLLDEDFNRLLNAMYRIDIREDQLADALNTTDQSQVATKIADLIIQRELQKVRSRKKYSGS